MHIQQLTYFEYTMLLNFIVPDDLKYPMSKTAK